MAAEPVVEPLLEPFERFIPRIVPQSEPLPSPLVEYPGQGAVQLWDDVYRYGRSIVRFFGNRPEGSGYAMLDDVSNAIDTAIGATIKSLSGYINRAAQIGVSAQQWASMELDAMSANIGAIYQYFDDKISTLEGKAYAIERLAIPSLQAQIDQLNANRLTDFQFNSAVDRLWSVDNIFKPLQEQLGQVAGQIPVWSAGALDRANAYTDLAVGGLGVNVLTQLVPMANALRAVEQEIDECAKPMCETMGPKTDLGKALKAFKAAEYLALLAAIAALDKDGVEGLIRALQGAAGGVFDAFGELFVEGHGTVSSTLTGIG